MKNNNYHIKKSIVLFIAIFFFVFNFLYTAKCFSQCNGSSIPVSVTVTAGATYRTTEEEAFSAAVRAGRAAAIALANKFCNPLPCKPPAPCVALTANAATYTGVSYKYWGVGYGYDCTLTYNQTFNCECQQSKKSTVGSLGTSGPQQVATISVKTLSGEVVDVKVPNIIRPGEQITGSVASSTLTGAVIDAQDKQTGLSEKFFKFIVPAGLASIPFLIKDKNGAELAHGEIPVNRPNIPAPGNIITVPPQQIELTTPHAPGSFAPMNYCQPGEPLTINGFFDGNASNTTVSINNIPCEIIAESSTGSFIRVPENLPAGKASITIQEGGVTQATPIQVVTTNLSSNKKLVQKNTRAKVTATVNGLENLDLNNNNFKIDLTNGTPAVIQFREANTTIISRDIISSNVKNGSYTFTTDITGISTGSFIIGSNLSSTTCTNCWEKYKNCIANCEAEEKKCYDACDKGNQGPGCYLACSAAARLCEAACWAEYLNCVRQKFGY